MLELLKVGHCFHPEAVVLKGENWREMKFPSLVGVIRHPTRGWILFDTGYARRFSQATHPFPERLYRWVTPFELSDAESLQRQLQPLGIAPDQVGAIFISHFHADHIAGLRDFPRARFICSRQGFTAAMNMGRVTGLIKAFLPALLPDDFRERCQFIEDSPVVTADRRLHPFASGCDIFADGSLLAVHLPGHALGHYGLMLESKGKSRFLVGDACWNRRAFEQRIRPHPIAHLIMDNREQYLETLHKLSELFLANKDLQIIPSHCQSTFEEYVLG